MVDGDNIASTMGEGGQNNNVGKDIQSSSSTGNTVNFNLPSYPAIPPGQDRGQLSMTAEESLRNELRELRGNITQLSVNVGKLDITMALEFQAAKDRLRVIEALVEKLENPQPLIDKRLTVIIISSLFTICVLLGAIAWFLSQLGGSGF